MTQTLIETDVLVVGTGPAGATAALALATAGVDVTVVTKYRWTADTPRAHITNQGAMEVFRALGIQEQVEADATPHRLIGDTVFCTSIAGEELGRLYTWGVGPDREGEYISASPTMNCDIPQTYLEPVLVRNAAERGAKIRFSTEYLSSEQDENGVTSLVQDRLTGEQYRIRSSYLIGADGARSKVAADIDLPMEGAMDIAGSMNILFKADLTHLVQQRPSVLYWVLQPGSSIGGIGMGLVRMVRPWNEWLVVWGYDITQPPPEMDDAEAEAIVRNLIGDPDLEIEIVRHNLWGNNEMYATHLQSGRIFCMGDAVHRHPPSNGLGSNTSVQDAYNLAWKLALVLRGSAGPRLLDSFSEERAPVAKQIVTRANQSSREFAPVFEALGVLGTNDQEVMRAGIESRGENSDEGVRRRQALHDALELKNYEFNALGVELGQRYRSGAVVPDGTPEPVNERDPELHYQATTWPGVRLPHAWIIRDGKRISTKDLVTIDGFALLTGIAGEEWAGAAARVAEELGVTIETAVIGPGRRYLDGYGDWTRQRGVSEAGAVLARPDGFVGWRSEGLPEDPEAVLREAVAALLGR